MKWYMKDRNNMGKKNVQCVEYFFWEASESASSKEVMKSEGRGRR